jgi:hypothetical protein
MQEIADWLEKLGMSEYRSRFAENGIDVSVLPHLTDSLHACGGRGSLRSTPSGFVTRPVKPTNSSLHSSFTS